METNAKTIFHNLRRSTAYCSQPELEGIKLHIIEGLCENRNHILSLFGQHGERAFGYLVEQAAILSPSIHKNTLRAQRIANFLLGELADSSGHVGLKRNVYNPDFLWITIQGIIATITGLGEVKSGLEAFGRKPKQLFAAAKNLPELIRKANRKSLPITKGLTLKLTQNLLLQLIVPKGEGTRIRKHFPYGVRRDGLSIQEIELTGSELIFITQQLLYPDYTFRPGMHFSENGQARYEDTVESFIAFCAQAIQKIFEEDGVPAPLNLREVTIFALATQKLAIEPEEIDFVSNTVGLWWSNLMRTQNHKKKLSPHFSRWCEYLELTDKDFAGKENFLCRFFLALEEQAKALGRLPNLTTINLLRYLKT